MSPSLFERRSEDVQVVENVLADANVPGLTRASLLKRAAAGVALAGVAAPLTALVRPGAARAADSVQTVGTVAVTAEALAITYLTRVIEIAQHNRTRLSPHALRILRAANQAEVDHYKFLTGAGFTPLATRFWIPNAFFGKHLGNVARTVETAETLFVNAYLIGITTFASNNAPDLARYAGEILGVEAEHRALARELQNKLPDNVGFEAYTYTDLNAIVGVFQSVGVGFGQQGSAPGRFYKFQIPDRDDVVTLEHNMPQ